jgi:UDP-glucuronate 4-epimerase
MAPLKFLNSILKKKEIYLYGDGFSRRDYTYISDIVEGIVAALDRPQNYAIYNLGNSDPVILDDFIALLENITGMKAIIKLISKQAGDVEQTYADIRLAQQYLSYTPKIKLETGLTYLFEWYKKNNIDKYLD